MVERFKNGGGEDESQKREGSRPPARMKSSDTRFNNVVQGYDNLLASAQNCSGGDSERAKTILSELIRVRKTIEKGANTAEATAENAQSSGNPDKAEAYSDKCLTLRQYVGDYDVEIARLQRCLPSEGNLAGANRVKVEKNRKRKKSQPK